MRMDCGSTGSRLRISPCVGNDCGPIAKHVPSSLIASLLLLSITAQAQTIAAHWQFLVPNQYHGNEAPAEPGPGWLALVATGGVWRLVPTQVRATRVVDPLVDNENGQKTGILISSDHEAALALLRIPGINPGKVDTPNMRFKDNPREMSAGGAPLTIAFKGTEFVIEPTPAGIFLTQGARMTRLSGLSAAGSESEDSASLLWAGDLDGDGQIDLLFSYSGHNRYGSCLYLSADAGKGNLVRQATCHGGLGC